jgi:GntR family transcriptional regulator
MTEKLMHNFPTILQSEFEAMIFDGRLPAGEMLYLNSISLQFNSDPVEMKKVLSSAFRKGLVEKNKDGSFTVLTPVNPSIESVFQHTARMGFKPTTIVRDVQIIESSTEIAQRLKVNPGDLVYIQVRSRLVEDRVLANQHNYIPVEVCPGLENKDPSHRSFQETLEQDYHAIVAEVEETCRVAPANKDDQQILDLSEKDDVIIVERLSLSATRQPLVWADIHVRIDRIDYVAALWPNAARLIKKTIKEV